MQTKFYAGLSDGIAVGTRNNGVWTARRTLTGQDVWAIAEDPHDPKTVYAAAHRGLFKSQDAGASWQSIGEPIKRDRFWAVEVSPIEVAGGKGVVYCGTEPAMLWRSEDAGQTWQDCRAIDELPSKPTWKYPPQPKTNHVRCIFLSPSHEGIILIGIEQGGIMRSADFGRTWRDRQPDGKGDAHAIRSHLQAPGRVYVAAGDGYAESLDDGDTWHALEEGLQHHYVMGLGIDPGDPDVVVTTNSKNWFRAHFPPLPSNTVYRLRPGGPWHEVNEGLPRPLGQRNTGHVATNAAEPHTFYFQENAGDVYRSSDGGESWQIQAIQWEDGHPRLAHCLVVTES